MQISKIKVVLGIILVCLLSSITVFAADETKTQELVSNGNIYISEDGSVEKVIRTYADIRLNIYYTREAGIAEKATNTGYHSVKLFSTAQHAKYRIVPSTLNLFFSTLSTI